MSEAPILRINCSQKMATLGDIRLPCRIGRLGYTPEERGKEGDAKTPLGKYHLRWGFYRADKLSAPPVSKTNPLNWIALAKADGWCDEDGEPEYNRFIQRPSTLSHEKLWREDGAYDLILVISHNDNPPISGKGSAVFIHVAQPDDRETLGCIALAPEDFVKLLPYLQMDMAVDIYA